MKSHGIGGDILCDNGAKHGRQGPVFMSEAWKELFAHVIREAGHAGIEISLNIQSSYSDPGKGEP